MRHITDGFAKDLLFSPQAAVDRADLGQGQSVSSVFAELPPTQPSGAVTGGCSSGQAVRFGGKETFVFDPDAPVYVPAADPITEWRDGEFATSSDEYPDEILPKIALQYMGSYVSNATLTAEDEPCTSDPSECDSWSVSSAEYLPPGDVAIEDAFLASSRASAGGLPSASCHVSGSGLSPAAVAEGQSSRRRVIEWLHPSVSATKSRNELESFSDQRLSDLAFQLIPVVRE